jgi:cytochrome c oxidase subunit 1
MHFLGFAGMPRRIADYPTAYQDWNFVASIGTILTLTSMVFFFAVYKQWLLCCRGY